MCDAKHELLPLLGRYLTDSKQSHVVVENVFYTLANICAERDVARRNAVIERASIIEFFDNCTNRLPPRLVTQLPWALNNLFAAGMTHVLDSESVVSTCFKLMVTLLEHLLDETNLTIISIEWSTAIKNSLQFLEKILSLPDVNFNYTGTVFREMALSSLPLQSLLEFGLGAESMEINLLSIKIIGIYYCEPNRLQIEAFTTIFPDAVSFITTNFLQPIAKINNQEPKVAIISNVDINSISLDYDQALGLMRQ